jgi:hypothetical protein
MPTQILGHSRRGRRFESGRGLSIGTPRYGGGFCVLAGEAARAARLGLVTDLETRIRGSVTVERDRVAGCRPLQRRGEVGFEDRGALVGVVAGVEEVRVDVEGGGRLGVAHLGGHEHDRCSGGDEQRGEPVAQVVGSQCWTVGAAEPGLLDRWAQDPCSDVGAQQWCSGAGGEDGVVVAACGEAMR